MDKETVEKLKNTLDEKTKELDEKFYLVPGKEDIAKKFDEFLKNDAPFAGRECVGIIELRKQINNYLTGKPGIEFMVDGTGLQALAHFLEKATGKGADDAEKMFTLFQSINQAMGTLKEDIDSYNILVQQWQSSEAQLAAEQEEADKKAEEEAEKK